MSASEPQAGGPAVVPPLPPRARRRYSTARSVLALMLREMSTRYGRSPGGYIWAVLEPLGAIFLLSFGFSLMLRSPSLGSSFLLFYATGYLPFSIYQTTAGTVGVALTFSRPLLVYPSVSWIDALLARWILNVLTGAMVGYLLLAGILATVDTRVVLDFLPILGAFALAALLAFGVGIMNATLMGLFPAWKQIWTILSRPLFLASGVIYIYEDVPQMAQSILWYNPLLHITGMMRSGFYPMYEPDYISVTYVLGCALILNAMGLVLLRRYHRDIINS